MKRLATTLLIIVFATLTALADGENNKVTPKQNNNTTISGQVIDMNTGESLVGVKIMIKGTTLKSYTDFDGNFEVKNLQSGTYDLVVSMISYRKSLIENLNSAGNNNLNIKLMEE